MLNRKALELQIGFLVIIILSISILILSFFLYQRVFSGSQQLSDDLNREIRSKIEKTILESGEIINPLAIPFNFVTIQGRDIANFGYAIINDHPSCIYFKIFVSFDEAYRFDKTKIENAERYFYIDPRYVQGNVLQVRKKDIVFKNIGISFKREAVKGVYIFNVTAQCGSAENLISEGFGYPTKIFVVVK